MNANGTSNYSTAAMTCTPSGSSTKLALGDFGTSQMEPSGRDFIGLLVILMISIPQMHDLAILGDNVFPR